MSAYACRPGEGSEQGVGWNIALEMAQHHDVWLVTRTYNRAFIETQEPVPGLRFVYYDFLDWEQGKQGRLSLQLYYYLWQLGIYPLARRLHQEVGFDVAHHVTFVRYWTPSFISFLPVPFIWGPIGGGESAPKAFWSDFSPQGRRAERLRETMRWVGEHDPFVRATARRSARALAVTADTVARLVPLGAPAVETFSALGFSTEMLARLETPQEDASPIRFLSAGNLLYWKGFHLGLRAFAKADLKDAHYWVVGDGPERARLEALANTLGVSDRVTFWGRLTREQTLAKLKESHVLVHPSLHDSGAYVCLEAMATGRPVLCLDLGGPGAQVTEETGVKVPAESPERAVEALAVAMKRLAGDEKLRASMARAGRERAQSCYSWRVKGELLSQWYREIA